MHHEKELRRVKYKRLWTILLGVVFWGIASSEGVAQNNYALKLGALQHTLSLTESYGSFLKSRYGVESIEASGSAFSWEMSLKGWHIGAEMDSLSGNFKYKDLNGNSKENKLKLTNNIFFLSLFLGSSWKLDGGVGVSLLSREFYGYKNSSIVASNITENQGVATSDTSSLIMMGQIVYQFSDLRQDFWGFLVGGRYSTGKHTIASTDERPALDSQGVPTNSTFETGGISYFLQFGIAF